MDRRLEAIGTLPLFGSAAREAIPALLLQLRDPRSEVRDAATSMLDRFDFAAPAISGSVALPVLLESLLDDPEPGVRAEALVCLALMGREAAAALPRVLATLEDPVRVVRLHAGIAVWRLSGEATRSLPVLCDVLSELVREDIEEQARKLARLEEQGRRVPGRTRVATAAGYERWKLTSAVLPCLGEMGPLATSAVPLLLAGLDAGVCRASEVQDALVRIGPATVGYLVPCLASDGTTLRGCAIEVLGRIGPAAVDAVPALEEQLRQETGAFDIRLLQESLAAILPPTDTPER